METHFSHWSQGCSFRQDPYHRWGLEQLTILRALPFDAASCWPQQTENVLLTEDEVLIHQSICCSIPGRGCWGQRAPWWQGIRSGQASTWEGGGCGCCEAVKIVVSSVSHGGLEEVCGVADRCCAPHFRKGRPHSVFQLLRDHTSQSLGVPGSWKREDCFAETLSLCKHLPVYLSYVWCRYNVLCPWWLTLIITFQGRITDFGQNTPLNNTMNSLVSIFPVWCQ